MAADSHATTLPVPAEAPPRAGALDRRTLVAGLAFFGAALVASVLLYLAYDLPGTWFPRVPAQSWDARKLTLTRGIGERHGEALAVAKPDESGLAVVSLATDFRAADYPGIAWSASGLPEGADARLLWRSDVRPDKLNSIPLRVEAGRTLPALPMGDPAWIGRITGLALALRGPFPEPVSVLGATAKPMGMVEVMRDRAREWFGFERWNGASINTVTGGADIQDLPLPVLIALVVAVSGVAVLLAVSGEAVASLSFRGSAFRRRVFDRVVRARRPLDVESRTSGARDLTAIRGQGRARKASCQRGRSALRLRREGAGGHAGFSRPRLRGG